MPTVKRKLPLDVLLRLECACGHHFSTHCSGATPDTFGCGCLECFEQSCSCKEFTEVKEAAPEQGFLEIRPAIGRVLYKGNGFTVSEDSFGKFHVDGPEELGHQGLSLTQLVDLDMALHWAVRVLAGADKVKTEKEKGRINDEVDGA